MKEQIKKLKEDVARSLAAGRAIVDKASNEKRNLTAEEQSSWDKCMKDINEFRGNIKTMESQLALESELSEPATRAIKETTGQRSEEKERAEIEMRAFKKVLLDPHPTLSAEETRALQVGPSGQGGFLVPVEFAKTILLKLKDLVYIRNKATVLGMTQAESIGVPSLETEPSDADWTSEIGVGNEETTIAFGKRELRPHPLAKLVKVSKKLIRSSVIDVEALVRDREAYKFGIAEEKAFLLGSGAEQPLGLFVASANGVDTSRDVSSGNTTTSIGGDGLQNAVYGIKKQYRKNAEWIFHRNALSQIATLKDGMGRYIFQPGLQLGAPDMLLGYPFNESEYAPSTFTTGLYVGLFGDLSYYWIADSLAMEMQPLFELYAASNQVGFIGRKETDGMPALAEAFARVKLA